MALGKGIVKSVHKMNVSPKNLATAAIIGGPTMTQHMREGNTTGAAFMKTAAELAFESMAPVLYWSAQAASVAPGIYAQASAFRRNKGEEIYQYKHNAKSGMIGGGYVDTQAALTMRQAALQQIQGNKMNARSALGNEARLFHPRNTRRTY